MCGGFRDEYFCAIDDGGKTDLEFACPTANSKSILQLILTWGLISIALCGLISIALCGRISLEG